MEIFSFRTVFIVTRSPFPVPPSVPNVTVDAVTATTITISWSQDPTDTIDHSVVMYDYMGPCFGQGVISDLFSLGSSTRNHVIADLRPNSQYLVIVDAQNAAGSSASEVNVSTTSAGNSLYQLANIALQVNVL